MKFRILGVIPLLVFFTPYIFSQQPSDCNTTLEGRVYDRRTEEPLPYVTVKIEGTTKGTVADEKGYFSIKNLCEKEHDLVFSYIGYQTAKHHHDFHHPAMEIYMAPSDFVLGSVVVEAQRSQGSLSSITSTRLDPEVLERVATESFGDVASQISGVNTLRTGQNIVKPVIHGLHSNRILVINNGLRHEFQNWGTEHAPEIDPSLIDNLEVIKGAATVRFGPEALGGVILINSPEMELSTDLQGEARLTGKTNGQSGEGTLKLQKGFKWLSLLGGGSFTKQGDLHTPNYQLTNTGKEELSYYGGFRIHLLPSLDIEGFYSHFEQELGILSGSVFGNLEDLQRAIESDTPFFTEPFSYDIDQPKQDTEHDLYKLTARYVGKHQSFTLRYGYQNNQRKEFGVRRIEAPNIDLVLKTESLDFDWHHPSIGNLSGQIGGQWYKQANDNLPGTGTVPFIPNYDSRHYGIYLIETFTLNNSLFELGLRYDAMEADITGREPNNTIYRNTIRYDNFTGTLGYQHEFNTYSTFRTNLGTAWRPPNVAELYRFGQHSFFLEYGLWRYTIDERFDFITTSQGILDQSDLPVPSEVGYKWINTYSINRPDFQMELTGYVNYIENYIYTKPGGLTRTPRGFFVYFLYDQTDALFWGIDLSSEWQHHDQFSSTLKGSYLWAKQISEDDFFVGQPPARLDYELAFAPSISFLDQNRFQLMLNYTFEQFQHPRIISTEEFLSPDANGINRFVENAKDFDLIPPPSGYLLTSISWNAARGHFYWNFQINNLFNVSYRNYTDRLRYFADDLGRNVILSLSYKW